MYVYLICGEARHMPQHMCGDFRPTLWSLFSFHLYFGFWRLNSCLQACVASTFTELSHWPVFFVFFLLLLHIVSLCVCSEDNLLEVGLLSTSWRLDSIPVFCLFEIGSYCTAQAGLELMIVLPQPPQVWYQRLVLPYSATFLLFFLINILSQVWWRCIVRPSSIKSKINK